MVLFIYVLWFLLLYGLLCECLFSCLLVEEVVCLFVVMGVEVCVFNLSGLLLFDDVLDSYLKVVELCEFVMWLEGMVWCLLEWYGVMIGIMKV